MTRYSRVQIHLHWLTLALITVTYAAMECRGWFAKGSGAYLLMKEVHYNAGCLVWLLMLARLGLKHSYRDPAILPSPPHWQILAAKGMHMLLYFSFIVLPLLGIAVMLYGEKSWSLVGIRIPQFVAPNQAIKSQIKTIHETLANIGYFLIALHAAAALFHHYVQHDNTLLRMMPARKKS